MSRELGGSDQLGGDGPSLTGREGPALLSRQHRVPEVERETVAVLVPANGLGDVCRRPAEDTSTP